MSKQRTLIARLVRNSRSHPSAENIREMARKEIPSISFGTVYRNLNLLAKEGTIRRICIANAPDRFDQPEFTHGHIACVCCGELFDLAPSAFQSAPQLPNGFEPVGFECLVRAVCPSCAAKP